MGLTSYEETVANLKEAYAILCGGSEHNAGLSAGSAFRCQCAVKDALNVLDKPAWVSVNEALPKPYKDVLVYVVCGAEWARAVGWLNGDEWVINDENVDFYTVTLWTPLPEPPKEGINDPD